jgi:hypothetical protein
MICGTVYEVLLSALFAKKNNLRQAACLRLLPTFQNIDSPTLYETVLLSSKSSSTIWSCALVGLPLQPSPIPGLVDIQPSSSTCTYLLQPLYSGSKIPFKPDHGVLPSLPPSKKPKYKPMSLSRQLIRSCYSVYSPPINPITTSAWSWLPLY